MNQAIAILGRTEQQRLWDEASGVKERTRVRLPRLNTWNYDACAKHEEPTPSCEYRACGFDPFDHQTISAAFLYMAKKGIDASQTGTGKTNSILLTLCLAKHFGEPLKAVLVVPTSAVRQWESELHRFAPGLDAISVTSGYTKDQRTALYASDWEVLIIGFHLMTRDIDALEVVSPLQVISDDVDPILQIKNRTHQAMVKLVKFADRVIVANATNLQTRLSQLYAASIMIGARPVWGSPSAFEARYVKKEPVYINIAKKIECPVCDGEKVDPEDKKKVCENCAGEGKVQVGRDLKKTFKATGYKNIDEFKRIFGPMMVRHKYEDLTDLRIPEITTENVYVDLYPLQRVKYDRLAEGVLELQKKDMPPQQKQVSAITAWTHGAQICAGLPALGEEDGVGASSKLDWVINKVTDDWFEQKIVVYARNQGTIGALQNRLNAVGVGHAAIWGKLTGADERAEEVRRFWEDPTCRVMIISAAGERSLNLQNASVLVSIDLNLNPARVMQILGRIRRVGSMHERVFAINLLATDTQEDRYMLALSSRQALFDAIHDEDAGDIFERLPADLLLRLISP